MCRFNSVGNIVKKKNNIEAISATNEIDNKHQTAGVEKNVISDAMTQDDVKLIQAPLIERISQRMLENGLNQGALAKRLGITPSYITSMFNGFRWVPKSDRRVIDAIAEYMDVPVIQVFVWAGFFGPADMVVENNLTERLAVAFKVISSDPLVRHITPPLSEWNTWDNKTKLRFVLLYEIMSSKVLMDHAAIEYKDSDLGKVQWLLQKK